MHQIDLTLSNHVPFPLPSRANRQAGEMFHFTPSRQISVPVMVLVCYSGSAFHLLWLIRRATQSVRTGRDRQSSNPTDRFYVRSTFVENLTPLFLCSLDEVNCLLILCLLNVKPCCKIYWIELAVRITREQIIRQSK